MSKYWRTYARARRRGGGVQIAREEEEEGAYDIGMSGTERRQADG